MTTAALRKALKVVSPEVRVSKVEDDHWTIRTPDKEAVERLLPSLGLRLDPHLTDTEGSRWDWITVLHVFGASDGALEEKKTPAQLDAEIAEALAKEPA